MEVEILNSLFDPILFANDFFTDYSQTFIV